MSQDEKILFVAAVALRFDPSACPVWLEGDTVVYPELEQVSIDEDVNVAAGEAYQEAIKRGFRVSAASYVATRQGDRVFLYQVSTPTARGSILKQNPFAAALLSRHLVELGIDGNPFQPTVLARPSALAERVC